MGYELTYRTRECTETRSGIEAPSHLSKAIHEGPERQLGVDSLQQPYKLFRFPILVRVDARGATMGGAFKTKTPRARVARLVGTWRI